MIKFILNNKHISTDLPPGLLVLDFVRYNQHLKGTKIGCREGDCGACTVLIGELKGDKLTYSSVTSCLTPIGNVDNKHVVTVEGINMERLNPVQQAMCDEGGTQCGFCTPGFIVAMAGFCLSDKPASYKDALASVDGNICRCTGYKSIERALNQVTNLMKNKNEQDSIEYVTTNSILPSYFSGIKNRLYLLAETSDVNSNHQNTDSKYLGGGTDLYVQQHDTMVRSDINFLFNNQQLKGINRDGDKCIIGGAATVSDLLQSPLIQEYFPEISEIGKLISSTHIRNIATFSGNFVNASPIGDFSIFFLSLGATLILSNGEQTREVKLDQFYKGYKQINKQPNEFISSFWFTLPDKKNTLFSFEKVSKRTHLDIASVNTAINLTVENNFIVDARLSAGGVFAYPLVLSKTSVFLRGKQITEELIIASTELAQTEISPISDSRGTEEYKRFLLSQLIKAHFIKLFPALEVNKLLV